MLYGLVANVLKQRGGLFLSAPLPHAVVRHRSWGPENNRVCRI